jgi:hypothetical protein
MGLDSLRKSRPARPRGGPAAKRGASRPARFGAVMAAACLILFANGVQAQPAAAYSSTQITPQYWWPHNGCSSPFGDSPSGVSFTYACNHHDGCYWGHWSNKWTCDWWFYNDMRAACGWNAWCQAWAYAYYRSVDTFGWPFYLCRCDPSPPWFRP